MGLLTWLCLVVLEVWGERLPGELVPANYCHRLLESSLCAPEEGTVSSAFPSLSPSFTECVFLFLVLPFFQTGLHCVGPFRACILTVTESRISWGAVVQQTRTHFDFLARCRLNVSVLAVLLACFFFKQAYFFKF